MDTVKKLISQDIAKKEEIRDIFVKLRRTQVMMAFIGAFLVLSIFLNVYFTIKAIDEIRTNREATFKNRNYVDSVLHKLDSMKQKK